MRLPKPNFSMRTLFLTVTVAGLMIGFSVRFGPHILWKTVHRKASSGIVAVPTRPLIDVDPDEELVACRIGPISFEIPKSFTNKVDFEPSVQALFFRDGDRKVVLALPRLEMAPNLPEFSKKARLTSPRLLKEKWDAQSSDFSFSMSQRELKWHQWLLEGRSAGPNSFVRSVEFAWRPKLDCVLVLGDGGAQFQWTTVDSQWRGTIDFPRPTKDILDWIRHLSVTFSIDGDLANLRDLTAAEVEGLHIIQAIE